MKNKKRMFLPIFLNLFFTLSVPFSYSSESEILLDDRAEMEEYLKSFPSNLYRIYEIRGQGKFYLDDIQDLIKIILKSGQQWEPHLISLINEYAKPGSVVADIGAHIGTLTIVMANRVGKNGYVHAFEPQKKIFRELVANAVLNNLQDRIGLHHYAIGDAHKLIEMHIVDDKNESGIGIVNVGEGGMLGQLAEMRTLDSFNLKNVSLIKIDVEGGEDEVIDGMTKTVQENRPVIIIEIQGGHPWESASPEIRETITHTKQKLIDLGYSVSLIAIHDYLAIPN